MSFISCIALRYVLSRYIVNGQLFFFGPGGWCLTRTIPRYRRPTLSPAKISGDVDGVDGVGLFVRVEEFDVVGVGGAEGVAEECGDALA